MGWVFHLHSVPYLVSAAIALGVAALARSRLAVPGASSLGYLMACTAWWSIGNLLELASPTLAGKAFWTNIEYLAIGVIPVLWLALAAQVSGQGGWLTRRNVRLLLAIPVATQVMLWTNPAHGLMFPTFALDGRGLYPVVTKTFGPWAMLSVVYCCALLLAGSSLLMRLTTRASLPYRRQAIVILLAAVVPWVFSILHTFNADPIPGVDFTPPAFAVSGLLLMLALFRFSDLAPIAHETLFAEMRDGVVAVDMQGRVVNLNPAAQRALGKSARSVIGQAAAEAWPDLPPLEEVQDRTQVALQGHAYDLLLSPVLDRRGNVSGRLVVLRDIGEQQRDEAERQRLLEELQQALADVRRLSGLLPICASCKKIRDDQGYWHEVDQYIRQHSTADFSRSICPDCLVKQRSESLEAEQ
ncbi:MAG: PAS domain-containing protein [Chloroflexi bacterium]|nr:PAS domain-containing protein [Chloroflexota bacterium]